MELRQLNYFLAAAHTQNFRRAAELCFVTQPALSRQIPLLEKEFGIALFKREKQHVRLTPAGHALTEYAKQATELLQQGQQELVRWQQGQSGILHIGCNPLSCGRGFTISFGFISPAVSGHSSNSACSSER